MQRSAVSCSFISARGSLFPVRSLLSTVTGDDKTMESGVKCSSDSARDSRTQRLRERERTGERERLTFWLLAADASVSSLVPACSTFARQSTPARDSESPYMYHGHHDSFSFFHSAFFLFGSARDTCQNCRVRHLFTMTFYVFIGIFYSLSLGEFGDPFFSCSGTRLSYDK